jgi:hypothetical protein
MLCFAFAISVCICFANADNMTVFNLNELCLNLRHNSTARAALRLPSW